MIVPRARLRHRRSALAARGGGAHQTIGEGVMRRASLSLSIVILAVGMAACASPTTTAQPSSPLAGSPSTNPCTTSPPVTTSGTLTVGTSFPYYQPFKSGPKDNPTGFEADVAHEIAKRLNLATVAWSVATFESLYAPG